MGFFRIVRSILGAYWQVRVRDAHGVEDTVDRLYTIEDCQRVHDSLVTTGLIALSDRIEHAR